jgi:hypothetical protein
VPDLPERLGGELVALAELAGLYGRNGPPWVVSEVSLIEFERLDNVKGAKLRQWWVDWADYFDGCIDAEWYPHIDPVSLMIRSASPVADRQLPLFEQATSFLSAESVPSFGPFADAGDRLLIRQAMRAGIPCILTTDIKSLWMHRRALYPFGIEVWRPSDLWRTLEPHAA